MGAWYETKAAFTAVSNAPMAAGRQFSRVLSICARLLMWASGYWRIKMDSADDHHHVDHQACGCSGEEFFGAWRRPTPFLNSDNYACS